MELADPFYARGEQFGIDLGAAKVVFTTRRGGYSRGPYASLNLGRLTDDDPAAVKRNRTALEAGLGVRLAFVRQVHGRRVCALSASTVARHTAGADQLPHADGLVSAEPGLAATVLTADCLPVAIAGERAVVMVHAGWRGLREGVIAAGVEALRAAGSDGTLSAAIGPGAGPCCYEVSEELHERFADQPAARTSRPQPRSEGDRAPPARARPGWGRSGTSGSARSARIPDCCSPTGATGA